MPVIYLAGPIDMVGADGQVWKTHFAKALAKHATIFTGQLTTFDPAAPYGLFGDFVHEAERSLFIEGVNDFALRTADVFLCLLPSNKASIGTPIELDRAHAAGNKIFVMSDIPYEKSVYLRNRVEQDSYIRRRAEETIEDWMQSAAQIVANRLSVLSDGHMISVLCDTSEAVPDAQS